MQTVLAEGGFDAFELLYGPHSAALAGAPLLPPSRCFAMHLISYREGIDTERVLAWRCADGLPLQDCIGLGLRQLLGAGTPKGLAGRGA